MADHTTHFSSAFLTDKPRPLRAVAAVPGSSPSSATTFLQEQHGHHWGNSRFQDWREAAQEVKRYAIANLDKLLVEFEQKMTANGATVLWAEDAAEANHIHARHRPRAQRQERCEVEVDGHRGDGAQPRAGEAGIRAVETDLGEYIVQLADQRPMHIVTPAIHMSAADVGHLFTEKLGEPYSEEHQSLTAIARRHLREEYLPGRHGRFGL